MKEEIMSKRLQTVACVSFMKTLLMLFNVFFWFSGVAILGFGLWMEIELHKYMEISTDFSATAPYVLIGTGAFIIVMGSLACCCTVKGQPVLLFVYAAFLMVVFVIELGACISAYAYRNKLKSGFEKGLNQSFIAYDHDKDKTHAVDSIQSTLHCCGIYEYHDWFKVPYGKIPTSCCSVNEATCDVNNMEDIYNKGCFGLVVEFFSRKIGIVAGTALAVAFFQIIGVFLACCLAKNINKAKYEQMA